MSQFPNSPGSSSQPPAGSGQLVLVGAIIAVLAVVLMNIYVEMRVAANDQDTITFFTFNGELDAGRTIEANDLTPIQVPADMEKAFGQDAIREDTPGSGRPADGVGFKLNVSVVKGEVLKSSQFLDTGRRVSRNDPKVGERQIALSVESDDQPANLAPGDRIDLLGAIQRNRSSDYMVIMEYVEVAAVGERRTESGDGTRSNRYGSITINVAPDQMKQLLAIQRALPDEQFRIALRAANDTATPETGGEAVINPAVLQALRIN